MNTTGRYGPFQRTVPYKAWWCGLWFVVAIGLIVAVWFRAPFMVWALAALGTFGVMEALGIAYLDKGYPPLTQVIVEYVPRWVAFTLIYFTTGIAAGTWFHVRQRFQLAVLAGILGWFTTHFDTAFDDNAIAKENTKYAWYAERLGLRGTSARLTARAERRTRPRSE